MHFLARLSHVALLLGVIALSAATSAVGADDYPNKPITIVIPFAAGSGSDQHSRAMGQIITRDYKVPVLIENKPGANGFIAAQHVAKAAPDGYTLLMTGNTTHSLNENLFKKLPYDPVKDFTPVALLAKGYFMLLVNSSSPAKSVSDLVNMAKKAPGKVTFGTGSMSTRMSGELFNRMSGIDAVHVPYKSNPLSVTDLMGGQIDFTFGDVPTAISLLPSGKLRGLAVSGPKRLATLPEIPTLDESGLKGYDMSFWTAIHMPAGGPPGLAAQVNEVLRKVSDTPELKAFFARTNGEPAFSSPEGLAQFQAAETEKWGRIIRAAKIEKE